MTRRFALVLVALSAVGGTSDARAQAVERDPVKVIDSTVIIDDKTIEDGKVTKGESGLTIGGREESGAERARRDAVETLEQGSLQGAPIRPQAATSTKVVVTGSAALTGSARDSACIEVGVIGTQDKCRPKTP